MEKEIYTLLGLSIENATDCVAKSFVKKPTLDELKADVLHLWEREQEERVQELLEGKAHQCVLPDRVYYLRNVQIPGDIDNLSLHFFSTLWSNIETEFYFKNTEEMYSREGLEMFSSIIASFELCEIYVKQVSENSHAYYIMLDNKPVNVSGYIHIIANDYGKLHNESGEETEYLLEGEYIADISVESVLKRFSKGIGKPIENAVYQTL